MILNKTYFPSSPSANLMILQQPPSVNNLTQIKRNSKKNHNSIRQTVSYQIAQVQSFQLHFQWRMSPQMKTTVVLKVKKTSRPLLFHCFTNPQFWAFTKIHWDLQIIIPLTHFPIIIFCASDKIMISEEAAAVIVNTAMAMVQAIINQMATALKICPHSRQ